MGSTKTELYFYPITKSPNINLVIGTSESSLNLSISPNNQFNSTNSISSKNNVNPTTWGIPEINKLKFLKINGTDYIMNIKNIDNTSIYGVFVDIKNRNTPLKTPYQTTTVLNNGIVFGNVLPKNVVQRAQESSVVKFYSESKLSGDSVSLNIGIYDNIDLPISVKSIFIPQNFIVTIYDEYGFTGKQIQLSHNTLMNNTTDLSNIYYIDNNNLVPWGDKPIKSWIICKIPISNISGTCGNAVDISDISTDLTTQSEEEPEEPAYISEEFSVNNNHLKWYVTGNGKILLKRTDSNTPQIVNNIQKYGTFSLHNIKCLIAQPNLLGDNILLTFNGLEEDNDNIWLYFSPTINIHEYCSAMINIPGSKNAITNFNEILNAGPTSLLIDNYRNLISEPDIPFSHDVNILTFNNNTIPSSIYQEPSIINNNSLSKKNDTILPIQRDIDESSLQSINDSQALQSSNDSQALQSSNDSQALQSSNDSQALQSSNDSQALQSSNDSQALQSSNDSQALQSSNYPNQKIYNYKYDRKEIIIGQQPSSVLYSWNNIIVYTAIILIIIILIYLILNI
jgi:hypothetical protein